MTKVILLQSVQNKGSAGALVDVKPGHARNYLIPTGRAIRATAENVIRFEEQRFAVELAEQRRVDRLRALAGELSSVTIPILMAATSSGTLYGSVSPRVIAERAASMGFKLNASDIVTASTIRAAGLYTVKVRLHPEVEAQLRIAVGPTREYIASFGSDGSTVEERQDRAMALLDAMAMSLVGHGADDLTSDLVMITSLADQDAGAAAEAAIKRHAGEEFETIVRQAIRSLDVDCLVGVDATRDMHESGTVHFRARVLGAVPAHVGSLRRVRLASEKALSRSAIELSLYSPSDLSFSKQVHVPVMSEEALDGLEVSQTVGIPESQDSVTQIWALASLNGECVHRRVWTF